MRLIDTETAAYLLRCKVRNVQDLVQRKVLTDHSELWPTGRRRRLLVDLDEVLSRTREYREDVGTREGEG